MKNEYGYNTPTFQRYTKKVGLRGGVWAEYGDFLPPFGVFVAGQIAFFIIFFLKIRTDFVPMNESDVKVKGPGPYSIERLKPRFIVDALSIEILLSKKV